MYGGRGGVLGATIPEVERALPVEVVGTDIETRFIVAEFACVVTADEVDTDEGGVSTAEPVKPVLRMVKLGFGGLGCTNG